MFISIDLLAQYLFQLVICCTTSLSAKKIICIRIVMLFNAEDERLLVYSNIIRFNIMRALSMRTGMNCTNNMPN